MQRQPQRKIPAHVLKLVIGIALVKEQVSFYNTKTNRCYVEITVHMADLDKYDEYWAQTLYDGQTREMLARVQGKKGVKSGMVFMSLHTQPLSNDAGYTQAQGEINALMNDDRKQ